MYIITQNLLLPDKEMPPNPVQAVCVAWSSSFLISSSVVPTSVLLYNSPAGEVGDLISFS